MMQVNIFSVPKGIIFKKIAKHIEKKIKTLDFQLEIITPVNEVIQNNIDFEKINEIKEEIEMLKNELLRLKNGGL